MFIQNESTKEIFRIHVKTPNVTRTEFENLPTGLLRSIAIQLSKGAKRYACKYCWEFGGSGSRGN